jgi:hypothetical protein
LIVSLSIVTAASVEEEHATASHNTRAIAVVIRMSRG